MKKSKSLKLCLSVLTGIALLFGNCDAASITKKKFLKDLDTIQSIFEVKYAPMQWKGTYRNWNINEAIALAKSEVGDESTVKECQIALRRFFNSIADYHVGIDFFSTEVATLPFLVKSAGNRYFFSEISKNELDEFPFEKGDELLTFDGKSVHEAVVELRTREWGSNTLETDHALATMSLTNRAGARGQVVPKGSVTITGRKKGSHEIITTNLQWDYLPEKIGDLQDHSVKADISKLAQAKDLKTVLKQSKFFEKLMVFHAYNAFNPKIPLNFIGARTSDLPALGKKIWQAPDYEEFDAYIFLSSKGKKIGYIRIPHYMGGPFQVEAFGEMINTFQQTTDALVIDQINNPGGDVFYLYALASTLTDHPLSTPRHSIALTQEEMFVAHWLLAEVRKVTNDAEAVELLGPTIGGYPIDYKFVETLRRFCRFLIAEWDQGQIVTDPIFLFGVDNILPHPQYRYTKPILVLINSLDFSGGDFFPAILQDNGIATLFGERTAGAGGYVAGVSFPNQLGIQNFSLTASFAERSSCKPIENLGVLPDISYEITVNDLESEYFDYVNAVQQALEGIVK